MHAHLPQWILLMKQKLKHKNDREFQVGNSMKLDLVLS